MEKYFELQNCSPLRITSVGSQNYYNNQKRPKSHDIKMDNKPLNLLPSRIKYYLLEWRDRNYDAFVARFGSVSLGSLSRKELIELFKDASKSDLELMTL